MFIKLLNPYDDRKLFREPASTCELAASGFCEERKSALRYLSILVATVTCFFIYVVLLADNKKSSPG